MLLDHKTAWLWASRYFLYLIGIIVVTLAFHVPQFTAFGFWGFPTPWQWFILASYYLGPFVFAFLAARMDPGPTVFRTVALTIFAVHLVYSAGVAVLHGVEYKKWLKEGNQVLAGLKGVDGWNLQYRDDNQDQLIDRVEVSGNLRWFGLPAGNYDVAAKLGTRFVDRAVIKVRNGQESAEFHLNLPADSLLEQLQAGPAPLYVELSWHRLIPPGAVALQAFGRWAAFFKNVSWAGDDLKMYSDIVPIGQFPCPQLIEMPRDQIQQDRVKFIRFLGDKGRDVDGDGFFEELVLSLEMDSIYDGPIYSQATVTGSTGQRNIWNGRTEIKKGRGTLELVIKGSEIRSWNQDGPYELSAFALINNDPYCPGGRCVIKEPAFSVYLNNYKTEPYSNSLFK